MLHNIKTIIEKQLQRVVTQLVERSLLTLKSSIVQTQPLAIFIYSQGNNLNVSVPDQEPRSGPYKKFLMNQINVFPIALKAKKCVIEIKSTN